MGVTSAGFGFSSAIFSPLQTEIINPGFKKFQVVIFLSKNWVYDNNDIYLNHPNCVVLTNI